MDIRNIVSYGSLHGLNPAGWRGIIEKLTTGGKELAGALVKGLNNVKGETEDALRVNKPSSGPSDTVSVPGK